MAYRGPVQPLPQKSWNTFPRLARRDAFCRNHYAYTIRVSSRFGCRESRLLTPTVPIAANVLFHVVNVSPPEKTTMIPLPQLSPQRVGKERWLHDEDLAALSWIESWKWKTSSTVNGPSGRTRHLKIGTSRSGLHSSETAQNSEN